MRARSTLFGVSPVLLVMSSCTLDTRPVAQEADEVTSPRVSSATPIEAQSAQEPRAPVAATDLYLSDASMHTAAPKLSTNAALDAVPLDDDAGVAANVPKVATAGPRLPGASASDEKKGTEASGGVRLPAPPVPTNTCQGVKATGLCWYLGSVGDSCVDACDGHGGIEPQMTSFVGNAEQGGSLAECSRVMETLGFPGPLFAAVRIDQRALGCHLWEDGMTYWIDEDDAPFEPGVSPYPLPARLACACKR